MLLRKIGIILPWVIHLTDYNENWKHEFDIITYLKTVCNKIFRVTPTDSARLILVLFSLALLIISAFSASFLQKDYQGKKNKGTHYCVQREIKHSFTQWVCVRFFSLSLMRDVSCHLIRNLNLKERFKKKYFQLFKRKTYKMGNLGNKQYRICNFEILTIYGIWWDRQKMTHKAEKCTKWVT